MKKLLPLAAVLCAAMAMPAHATGVTTKGKAKVGSPIHESYFNRIDLNHDGVISREENDMFSASSFNAADVNRDGVLSRNEIKSFKTSGYRYTAQGSPYQIEKESTGGMAGNDLQPSAGNPPYPGSKSEYPMRRGEYPTARNEYPQDYYYSSDRMVRY